MWTDFSNKVLLRKCLTKNQRWVPTVLLLGGSHRSEIHKGVTIYVVKSRHREGRELQFTTKRRTVLPKCFPLHEDTSQRPSLLRPKLQPPTLDRNGSRVGGSDEKGQVEQRISWEIHCAPL